jgi:hypothetical protein
VSPELVPFLQAVAATTAWLNGLFFMRFWRESRDVLFMLFGAAFWLLALSWAALSVLSPDHETRVYIYGIRLLAFLLIIVAIIQKNRGTTRRSNP